MGFETKIINRLFLVKSNNKAVPMGFETFLPFSEIHFLPIIKQSLWDLKLLFADIFPPSFA